MRLIYFLILSLLSVQILADTFTGKVVRVLDADTVEVLADGAVVHRVRLAGIDAPEARQSFRTRAKQKLLALVGGERVEVDWHKRDKYRRIVGKLIADGQDVNLAMVRSGSAWWYRKYAGEQSVVDRTLYRAAEDRARGARAGLWVDSTPMAPWDWRHKPEPAGGYAVECPCGSGDVCIGKRGDGSAWGHAGRRSISRPSGSCGRVLLRFPRNAPKGRALFPTALRTRSPRLASGPP